MMFLVKLIKYNMNKSTIICYNVPTFFYDNNRDNWKHNFKAFLYILSKQEQIR